MATLGNQSAVSPKVPSKSYPRQYEQIWPEIEGALRRAFFEDDPVLGEAVSRFEAQLASYHEVDHAIGVGSGTDAIHLLLRALGIGPGDEVVTGAHTFTGVLNAICLAGATPVLVEPEPKHGLMDPGAVEAVVTPRTRAIFAVHMYGHPVDIDAVAGVAKANDLVFLEDAAQAHGAKWNDRSVGSFGRAAILSFHPSKNLGAYGDGGAVLTRDAGLAEQLRVDRNLGKAGKYDFAKVSFNSKLDTVQAAILEVKLRHLETWVARRRELAQLYLDGLRGVGDLRLPTEDPRARHAYHLFVVRTAQRDALKKYLHEQGIKAGLHYPVGAHRQPAHRERFDIEDYPLASRWADEVLTLPLSHEHQDAEIRRVIAAVRTFFE